MSLSLIFNIIILAIDFAISIWNGYASGYNIGMMKRSKKRASNFQKAATYSGLGLGFVGAAYVLVFVISVVAYALGYVNSAVVSYALAFNFIVFGILIIGFGIMVTIQSIEIAAKKRNVWSIIIAIWNIFAMVWDITSYIEGFKESMAVLKKTGSRNQGNALVIVLAAVLLAFFIVHAAYRRGFNKAYASQTAIAK